MKTNPRIVKARKNSRPTVKTSKLKGKCVSGKPRYRDHGEAITALHSTKLAAERAIALTGSTKRKECRAYHCPNCSGWHLSSKSYWSVAA